MNFDVEPNELLQLVGELYVENRKLLQLATNLKKQLERQIHENEIPHIEPLQES